MGRRETRLRVCRLKLGCIQCTLVGEFKVHVLTVLFKSATVIPLSTVTNLLLDTRSDLNLLHALRVEEGAVRIVRDDNVRKQIGGIRLFERTR
jgi:hypothetical protein